MMRTPSRSTALPSLLVLWALPLLGSACGAETPMAPNAEEVEEVPEDIPASRTSVGTFTGLAGHAAQGRVTFTVRGDVGTITFHDSFSSSSVPDPWVYVNTNDDANQGSALRVARLRMASGGQQYSFRIPADGPAYRYVLVWCDRYNVGVGAAALDP